MKPLPDAALPIVLLLRELVPRPEMPTVSKAGYLQFEVGPNGSWHKNPCCLLGLLPKATRAFPISSISSGRYPGTKEAAYPLFAWWDSLAVGDAAEAMDLIWPQQTGGG